MTATEQETEQELDSLELTKRSSLGGISFPSLFFIWAILGISPFILFHWLTQSYLRVIAWPWMLAWQAGFILIILLGVGILRYFRVPPQLLGYGLDWFVGLFALAIVLSTLFAPFPIVALWNVSRILCFLILLYVGRNCINSEFIIPRIKLEHLWLGIITVGMITGIISLILWRPNPEMWLSQEFNDAIRNHLPLGNNNFMGGYEVLLFPLSVTFTLAYSHWRRMVGGFASIVSVTVLYTSGSRGALLGAIVIVFLFALAFLFQTKGKQRWLAIGMSGLSFLLMGIALFSNPRIRQFLVAGGFKPAIDRILQDGPIQDRLIMLQSLGHLLHDRPWVGVGSGNMSLVYNLYRPIESGNWSMHVQQLHNTPAQILGELGIFGFLAYGGFLGYFIWLNLKLYSHWETKIQQYLSLGIGISFLGYATSSLTDYQLENIGISTLLITNLWLFTALLDTTPPGFPFPWGGKMILNQGRLRRSLSLIGIGFWGLCLFLWSPIDAAAAVSLQATRQAIAGDFVAADRGWSQSASLVSWDPIYAGIAGQKLLGILGEIENETDRLAVKEQAIDYYRQVVSAAPNDALFQHNLAVVLLDRHAPEAIEPAERSVTLQNRDSTYSYYTLGLAYLGKGDVEKAIDAFVLQGLSIPHFLTFTLQNDPALQSLRSDILARSLPALKQLLETTSPQSPGYGDIQEQVFLVRWWNEDLSATELKTIPTLPFRPLVKALILAETDPQLALNILTEAIDFQPDSPSPELRLLRSWLDPDRYFEDLAAILETPEQRTGWQQNLQTYRNLREWLGSITAEEVSADRLALWLTYRNINAVNASRILLPPDITISRIARDLNLHPGLPRYFPPLDRLINHYRIQRLGLDRKVLKLNEKSPSQKGRRIDSEGL